MAEEDLRYAQAKYRELTNKIEALRSQISLLDAELRSIDEALKKLEGMPEGSAVYERAGLIFVRRSREEVIEDLKGRREAISTILDKYRREEQEARQELKQLLDCLLYTSPSPRDRG